MIISGSASFKLTCWRLLNCGCRLACGLPHVWLPSQSLTCVELWLLQHATAVNALASNAPCEIKKTEIWLHDTSWTLGKWLDVMCLRVTTPQQHLRVVQPASPGSAWLRMELEFSGPQQINKNWALWHFQSKCKILSETTDYLVQLYRPKPCWLSVAQTTLHN